MNQKSPVFLNHFTDQLPGDSEKSNTPRQVLEACYSFVKPKLFQKIKTLHISEEAAKALNLDPDFLDSKAFSELFAGQSQNGAPYAMCYGGHQFGHWAGQLGDGRAINLGQLKSKDTNYTLQVKGAGNTPYSRRGDGLAVLRSSIREHLCSEAMYHLGVPTTRSLALFSSGESVLRDMLYDGNAAYEPGAIVCRFSESFIRFGSFEIFAARKDKTRLSALVDYTINNHFPQIQSKGKDRVADFFQAVCESTLSLVIHWQRIGFVHGVLNTDNMSILGETIDFGPYGWIEPYDPNWTPNTSDLPEKRYRFGAQGDIIFWNLHKLANALYPLLEDQEPFVKSLNWFKETYPDRYLDMYRAKLGLTSKVESDQNLIHDLLQALPLTEVDMTIFFRKLADFDPNSSLDNLPQLLIDAMYDYENIKTNVQNSWLDWFKAYAKRLGLEPANTDRKVKMNAVNPKYILRNYMVDLAIQAAEKGDLTVVDELHQLALKPYDEQADMEKWFAKRPDWAREKVGCSMLSCSS